MPFRYDINPTVRKEVDGIFEGGGTLGTAFIGSLLALHRNGIWFKRVAGNSAGAITAALIAVGYNANELDWLTAPPNTRSKPDSIHPDLSPISFQQFMDRPKTEEIQTRRNSLLWHLLKGTLFDDLLKFEVPLPPLDRYFAGAAGQILNDSQLPPPVRQGLSHLRETLSKTIERAFRDYPETITVRPALLALTEGARRDLANQLLDKFLDTFPDARSLAHLACDGSLLNGDKFLVVMRNLLKGGKFKERQWRDKKLDRLSEVTFKDLPLDLVLIASNITKSEPIIYSKLRTPDYPVAEAVRQSMSVPFFFEPYKLSNGDEVVDGGLVENFPWWVFFPLDPSYPQPAGATASGSAAGLRVKMPRAVKLLPDVPGLGLNLEHNGIAITSAIDVDRPKIAFYLDEDADRPTDCPKGPWEGKSERERLLVSLRESRVLDFDIGQVAEGIGQGISGRAMEAFKLTAEARLIERFSQVNRISSKPLVNSVAFGLAAERYKRLYLNSIPLSDFYWLDFTVNKDEGKFNSCAARGWEATSRLIRDKDLASSIGALSNPYLI